MEFKAGDKVRIKSWEAMEAEFGLDGDGDIKRFPWFVTGMRGLCGSEVTVVSDPEMTDFGDEDDCEVFEVVGHEEFEFATWMVEEVISGF